YRGLTVSQLEKIRVELKKNDSEIRIAKNTLLRRAVSETAGEVLIDDFTGTTAVVMAYGDPVAPAKAIAKFADDHDKFVIRSAVLEGEKISADELIALSKLPSKEVLLGQMLSVLNGVPTGLVQLSELIKEFEEKFGVSAAAPVAVAAAGAAPAEAAAEEKTEFDVILAGAGDQKIKVIKEVRAITSLGLKEAKALVEGAPQALKEGAGRTQLTSMAGPDSTSHNEA
ncbi:unnamed protein product, partial [Cyprideis torosa]